jgi:diguanylate cyclase (GGDEF)-like protein
MFREIGLVATMQNVFPLEMLKTSRQPSVGQGENYAFQPRFGKSLEDSAAIKHSRNRAKLLGATRTLFATLANSAAEEDLLQASIEALMELIQVKYGAVSILDAQGNFGRFVYAGISAEDAKRISQHPGGAGLLGKVVRENVVLRLDSIKDDSQSTGFPANHPPMTSLLAVPISNRGRIYGRIYLCDKFDRHPFSDEDEELAVNYANALSLILDHERKLAELKQEQTQLIHYACHDPLTDLPNRALLDDRIGQVLSHAQRNQTQAAILFCDLDDFKSVNDSMGHHAGDQVLKTLSQRLMSCLRDGDTVARVGGDEFVFVMPNVESAEHTKVVAQKILDVMAQAIHVDGCEIMLSGSVGIAIFPLDGEGKERLLKNADAAMYKAKERGKNNFRFFNEALHAG